MTLGNTLRTARTPVVLAVAVAALTACSAEVNGPSEEDARSSGRDYGETIKGTIGARATTEEMETLCGKGAMKEGLVTEGREGDETDLEIDAFVTACLEAVKQE